VIEKLASRFPTNGDEQGFKDGRFHSFRHFFCSQCANQNIPQQMVMEWVGHADSEMVRHYYHLHDTEARNRMNQLNLFGEADGRSISTEGDVNSKEPSEPQPERSQQIETA
jgi:integrase